MGSYPCHLHGLCHMQRLLRAGSEPTEASGPGHGISHDSATQVSFPATQAVCVVTADRIWHIPLTAQCRCHVLPHSAELS